MTETFLKLIVDNKLQIKEDQTQQEDKWQKKNNPTQTYHIKRTEHQRVRDYFERSWGGRGITYRGISLRIIVGFSEKNASIRRGRAIFKVLKEKSSIYNSLSSKAILKGEGEIKTLRQTKAENLSPADLPCKKYLREFFRQQKNYPT